MNTINKIEIGCGKTKHHGYIGIDRIKVEGVDIIADMNNLPFKSESIDEVLAVQVLEHSPDLLKTMSEIYRVLKVGGKLIGEVCHGRSVAFYSDFTHHQPFNIHTMTYFTEKKEFSYYSSVRFNIIRNRFIITSPFKFILLDACAKFLEWFCNKLGGYAEYCLGMIPFDIDISFEMQKVSNK